MENEAIVISKIKNIYIMLLDSIMDENIEKVSHFLSKELIEKYKKIIDENVKKNVFQCYDLLNISNIQTVYEDAKILRVTARVKYIDYQIDKATKKVVSGDDKQRLLFDRILVFKKNSVEDLIVHKCPNCGANLNINEKSFCEYCNKPIDKRYSDLILSEIY